MFLSWGDDILEGRDLGLLVWVAGADLPREKQEESLEAGEGFLVEVPKEEEEESELLSAGTGWSAGGWSMAKGRSRERANK